MSLAKSGAEMVSKQPLIKIAFHIAALLWKVDYMRVCPNDNNLELASRHQVSGADVFFRHKIIRQKL